MKAAPTLSCGAMPRLAAKIAADFRGAVDFGVGERFVARRRSIPGGRRRAEGGQFLLGVQTESVFHAALLAIKRNIRNGVFTGKVTVDRLAITAHVGVITKASARTTLARLGRKAGWYSNFEIFATSASDVPVEVMPVGHGGHEHLAEAGGPVWA